MTLSVSDDVKCLRLHDVKCLRLPIAIPAGKQSKTQQQQAYKPQAYEPLPSQAYEPPASRSALQCRPAPVGGICCQASVVSQTRADQTARKKNRCVSTDGNWLAQRLRHLTMSEPPHHRPAVPPHRRWMRTGSPYELPGPPLPERQRLPDNRIPATRPHRTWKMPATCPLDGWLIN